MAMTRADHLYDIVLPFLTDAQGYHQRAAEALSALHDLADPNAEALRVTQRKHAKLIEFAESNNVEHDHGCKFWDADACDCELDWAMAK